MMVYKKHLQIMTLNPCVDLVRLKADLVGYTGIEHEIETDVYTWGKVKRDWLPPKPSKMWDQSEFVRTTEYTPKYRNWKITNEKY